MRSDSRLSDAFRPAELFELFELVPVATAVVDQNRTILYVNAAVTELLGWTRGELEEVRFETLVPERFRESHCELFRRYSRAPEPRSLGTGLELWGLHKDGCELPIDIAVRPWTRGRLDRRGSPRSAI